MNSITFSVGFLMAILMVCVSSKDYYVMSDTNKVNKSSPYNFSFSKLDDFLLMEITLKNIPPSVTDVNIIYSLTNSLATTDTKPEKEKVNAEIKNGEVKILILRSLNYYRIVIDVELKTREGLCNKARVAEGRLANNYNYYNDPLQGYVYWYTNWKYDVSDTGACLVPKLCEIVVNFQSQCEENLKCYINGKQYICTFYTGKMKPYKLYQTYDSDRQRTKPFFREDYTNIDAVDSFYKIHTTPKNWNDASKACVKEGASLFYPENSDEANAVMSFWKKNQKNIRYMYVGISETVKEGAYVTIDGKPIEEVYNKWFPGQPDHHHGNEHCVHLYLSADYNDVRCDLKYNFICKKSLSGNLSTVIGVPLDYSVGYTKFIFELESFDNNTSVHVETQHGKDNPFSDKIILPTEEPVKDIVNFQSYSETTEVQFSCEKYKMRSKYLYLGLINTTGNKIKTFDKTQMNKRKFTKADNGSILCCLYYVYNPKNDGKEVDITRFVVNKTLLKYQIKEAIPSNPAQVEEQWSASKDNDYNWLIYVYLSAAVLGVSILILAIYIISKKRCSKNSQPLDETVELDNQENQDQVLYANLEFQNNTTQPSNQNEEPHYANIVGVLHPI